MSTRANSGAIYKTEKSVRTNFVGGWTDRKIKYFILENVMLKWPVRHPREVNKANRYFSMKFCREVWDGDKISKSST